MARRGSKAGRDIATYERPDKERVNNPPVGSVTPQTDGDGAGKSYAHDPHLDPHRSWSGKAEHTSFEVPTVSLHVHERVEATPEELARAVMRFPAPVSLPFEPGDHGRPAVKIVDDRGVESLKIVELA